VRNLLIWASLALVAGCGDDPAEPAPTCEVVVTRPDGTPAAGASIARLAPARWRNGPPSLRDDFPDPWSATAAVGDATTTDAQGRARIPMTAAFVVARAEGLFGIGTIGGRGANRLAIALAPDVSRNLLVQHADGTPAAGVPVALWTRAAVGRDTPVWSWTTGPDGRARAAHLQVLADGAGADTEFVATIEIPGVGLQEAEAGTDPQAPAPPPATDPQILTLPPCGTVSVLVVSAEGQPIEGAAVRLSVVGPLARRFGPRSWPARPSGTNGRVEIGPVPVGLALQLEADPQRFEPVKIDGPREAGQTARAELRARRVQTGG